MQHAVVVDDDEVPGLDTESILDSLALDDPCEVVESLGTHGETLVGHMKSTLARSLKVILRNEPSCAVSRIVCSDR